MIWIICRVYDVGLGIGKEKMNLLVVGRGVWYVTWKEGKVSKLKIFVLFWKNLFYDTLLHIPLEFHIRDA